jgi:hypothetical protein
MAKVKESQRSTGVCVSTKEKPLVISDSGLVRIGNFSPAFPPPVRSTPSHVSDTGKVRVGNFSPAFPRRSR